MSPDLSFEEYILRFERYLGTNERPGLAAQMRMSPLGRIERGYDPAPKDARRSAVLIGLYNRRAGLGKVSPCFPAIVRSRDGSPHSGQIALPGGAAEAGEEFPVETALRESFEEIGLPGSAVRVLGLLTPLYISVSNYTVTPVVATFVDGARSVLKADPNEVEQIIDLDILQLAESDGVFEAADGLIRAPCYVANEEAGKIPHTIWGATAMILAELLACHERVIA